MYYPPAPQQVLYAQPQSHPVMPQPHHQQQYTPQHYIPQQHHLQQQQQQYIQYAQQEVRGPVRIGIQNKQGIICIVNINLQDFPHQYNQQQDFEAVLKHAWQLVPGMSEYKPGCVLELIGKIGDAISINEQRQARQIVNQVACISSGEIYEIVPSPFEQAYYNLQAPPQKKEDLKQKHSKGRKSLIMQTPPEEIIQQKPVFQTFPAPVQEAPQARMQQAQIQPVISQYQQLNQQFEKQPQQLPTNLGVKRTVEATNSIQHQQDLIKKREIKADQKVEINGITEKSQNSKPLLKKEFQAKLLTMIQKGAAKPVGPPILEGAPPPPVQMQNPFQAQTLPKLTDEQLNSKSGQYLEEFNEIEASTTEALQQAARQIAMKYSFDVQLKSIQKNIQEEEGGTNVTFICRQKKCHFSLVYQRDSDTKYSINGGYLKHTNHTEAPQLNPQITQQQIQPALKPMQIINPFQFVHVNKPAINVDNVMMSEEIQSPELPPNDSTNQRESSNNGIDDSNAVENQLEEMLVMEHDNIANAQLN